MRDLVPDHGRIYVLGPGDLAQRPAGARAPPAHGSRLEISKITQARRVPPGLDEKVSEIDGTAGATRSQVRDDDQVILADKTDGAPMPDGLGPYRLVVEGDQRGARLARMVVSIELRQLAPGSPK